MSGGWMEMDWIDTPDLYCGCGDGCSCLEPLVVEDRLALSCGCWIAQSRVAPGGWSLGGAHSCRFRSLHVAWLWNDGREPRVSWWRRSWTPSRFERWCVALMATFCAVYGPISTWGWDAVGPPVELAAAGAWGVWLLRKFGARP